MRQQFSLLDNSRKIVDTVTITADDYEGAVSLLRKNGFLEGPTDSTTGEKEVFAFSPIVPQL